jgi:uroporphyrinogen-III decarboxylase
MKVEVCLGIQTSLFSGLRTSIVFDAYVYITHLKHQLYGNYVHTPQCILFLATMLGVKVQLSPQLLYPHGKKHLKQLNLIK